MSNLLQQEANRYDDPGRVTRVPWYGGETAFHRTVTFGHRKDSDIDAHRPIYRP